MIHISLTGAQSLEQAEHPREVSQRISVFVPTLAGGGAEQVMLTLAQGFLGRGHTVDVVVVKAEGELLSRLPQRARLVELGARRVMFSVPALVRYLRRERPAALLSTLQTANVVAVISGMIARRSTCIAIRQAAHLSRDFEKRKDRFTPILKWLIRWSYRRADAVVAVSNGVAEDLAELLRLPLSRIHVVPNPVVTREVINQASQSPEHEWFATDAPPVVIGIGRLAKQKRFDVLIQAFAEVHKRDEARLIILGEGEERTRLEQLIRELRIERFVLLPGYVANPFAYLARARVFVLSSDFEGLPGALIQALACGTPVVATDCDSGPREILQNGRMGRLVPVGDVASLADAIHAVLREPRGFARSQACLPFTEAAGVDGYLRVLRSAIVGNAARQTTANLP